MAVTVQNEWAYNGPFGWSYLISPFMRPVLLFKVSGDGSLTAPEAVLRITGAVSEVVNFDCTYLAKDGFFYYYQLDLSDVLKYLMRNFDGVLKPDDLDFQGSAGISTFDEYFLSFTGSAMQVIFEEGTANEDTGDIACQLLYAVSQLPNIYGFNLYDIAYRQNLPDLKWSNDTYNALFFWSNSGGAIEVVNSSMPNLIAGWSAGSYDTFTRSGGAIVSAIDAGGGASADSNPILSVTSGDKIKVSTTLTLNSGQAPYLQLYSGSKGVISNVAQLSAGATSVILTATQTASDLDIVILNTQATNFSATAFTAKKLVFSGNAAVGYNQLKFEKAGATSRLISGLNNISMVHDGITTNLVIDYDPDCTYINLCWQHPEHGYVSFPFNGVKLESRTWIKGESFEKFLSTLINVTSLKEITGYEGRKILTVNTKADAQYWPLLQELHGSRHVYLFIGAAGAVDSASVWLECEVAGGSSVRTDKVRGTFSVDLIMPEHFNIRF